jgi:hypothetical protein
MKTVCTAIISANTQLLILKETLQCLLYKGLFKTVVEVGVASISLLHVDLPWHIQQAFVMEPLYP